MTLTKKVKKLLQDFAVCAYITYEGRWNGGWSSSSRGRRNGCQSTGFRLILGTCQTMPKGHCAHRRFDKMLRKAEIRESGDRGLTSFTVRFF